MFWMSLYFFDLDFWRHTAVVLQKLDFFATRKADRKCPKNRNEKKDVATEDW